LEGKLVEMERMKREVHEANELVREVERKRRTSRGFGKGR